MSAAAGAPQFGSVTTEEGLRRSARISALMEGENAITDERLADALADAFVAAEEVTGAGVGGQRKDRGGGKTVDAIKNFIYSIGSGSSSVVSVVDNVLGTAINTTAGTMRVLGSVGAAAVVLNHPTMIGNLAKLSAAVLRDATNSTFTSTWGDWGEAIVSIGESVKTLGEGLVEQSVQGPVVPVAVAIAILTWYANKSKKSVTEVLKSSVIGFASKVSGQIDVGTSAYKDEAFHKSIRQLKELAKRSKVPTSGEGAKQQRMAFLSSGIPAASQGPEEGISIVPGTEVAQKGDFKEALNKIAELPESKDPLESSEKAAAFVDALDILASVAAAESPIKVTSSPRRPLKGSTIAARKRLEAEGSRQTRSMTSFAEVAPPPAPSTGKGRRKTRGKKAKRRVTRRKITFAY
jgi:hypothetical protein